MWQQYFAIRKRTAQQNVKNIVSSAVVMFDYSVQLICSVTASGETQDVRLKYSEYSNVVKSYKICERPDN